MRLKDWLVSIFTGEPKTEVKVKKLQESWNTVYILKRPEDSFYDSDELWVVRNHTDEGLGAGDMETKSFRGATLEETLDKAIESKKEN